MVQYYENKNDGYSDAMDRESFITVSEEVETQFTEKKSIFISSVFIIEDTDAASRALDEIRKKYPDATHNCYAYVLNNGAVQRFSDDGEPSGTAGMPILNVINKLGLTNVLVIVTRYFGGVKLGAGGLVRAYSQGAADVLRLAGKAVFVKGSRGTVETDYNDHSAVERMLLARGITVEDKAFGNGVIMRIVTKEPWEDIEKAVTDITGGGAICEFKENVFVKE